MHPITTWVDQYGYFVLFFGLLLELIAFGLPTELMMAYAGFLVYRGHLNWSVSILTAGSGSIIGMTISYWIGNRLGAPFFEKHGARFHLGPDRLKKASEWFNRYGNTLLLVAYFIPGVRHVTGYFSGITHIPYRVYAIYAYIGAVIWVSTFITLGKIFGPNWDQYHRSISKFLLVAMILASVLIILVKIYRKYGRKFAKN